MFVDTAKIEIKAGKGGDGCQSFYKDKFARYPVPNGGPGGDGGDIIILSNENIHTLLDFQYRQHFKAQKGDNGSSNNKNGKNGQDCVIQVPPGTIIKDYASGLVLRDLKASGESFVAAKGGRGGRGNASKKPSTKGEPGEEKILRFDLKLIADCGLIGFPNAGKSSIISKISKAKPKIAPYPFTTKEPVLGIVEYGDNGKTFKVADIPGLIEGAHAGKGLGDKFLRHVERTKILVHVIDMAGTDRGDPAGDFITLNDELKLYGAGLENKAQLVVANKMDLPGSDDNLKKFMSKVKKDIIAISALTGEGMDALKDAIAERLDKADEG